MCTRVCDSRKISYHCSIIEYVRKEGREAAAAAAAALGGGGVEGYGSNGSVVSETGAPTTQLNPPLQAVF